MIFFCISLICFGIGLLIVMFQQSVLRKRLENADARIVRLEQVEDRRHGFDQAMAQKDQDDIMKLQDKMIKLRCKPDENCPKCHGRGHIGKNLQTGLFIPCVCCA